MKLLLVSDSVCNIIRFTVSSELFLRESNVCFVQQLEHKLREFFVKWHELSYWHCEWVSELQV